MNGLEGGYIRSLAVSGSKIFAGTDNSGVFFSTNTATNWTPANVGLTENTYVNSLVVSGGNDIARTDINVKHHTASQCLISQALISSFVK
jgi:hypothetical protein